MPCRVAHAAKVIATCAALAAPSGCNRIAPFNPGASASPFDAAFDADVLGNKDSSDEAGRIDALPELSVREGGADLRDAFPPTACVFSEDKVTVSGVTLGGLAVDPRSAIAYVAGVDTTGSLWIYSFAACEATLRPLAKARLTPANIAGGSFTIRSALALGTLGGSQRLCVAGGAADLQSTDRLFLACMRVKSDGTLLDLTQNARLLWSMRVEKVHTLIINATILVAARSNELVLASVAGNITEVRSLGTSTRLGGLQPRIGGYLLGLGPNAADQLLYELYPPGCLDAKSCTATSFKKASTAPFFVDAFAADPTAKTEIWLGGATGTLRTLNGHFRVGGVVTYQSFGLEGNIHDARLVGTAVWAVGKTTTDFPFIFKAPIAAPDQHDSSDWNSTKGELVALSDLFARSILVSGTYQGNLGVLKRCPPTGCNPVTP